MYRLVRQLWKYEETVPVADLGKVIRVLGREVPLRLLCLVWHEELCVEFCVRMLIVEEPQVSRAFKDLWKKGLLTRREEGRFVFYRRIDRVLHPAYEGVMEIAWKLACATEQVELDRSVLEEARKRRGVWWRAVKDLPWPKEDERLRE